MKFSLAVVSLFLPLVAFSADILSWEKCVELATKNNADLQAAVSAQQATELQEGVARSGFLPELSADLGFSRSNSGSVSSGIGSDFDDNFSASLNASQNLFAGLQDTGKLRQAKAKTEASHASLQAAKARVSFELKRAFAALQYAKRYEKLTSEIIRRRQENLRLVELRFQSGRENKGSVLLSQAYLNQAKYDDLQAKNAKRIALAQLAQNLGLDEFQEFDISGESPVLDPPEVRPDFRAIAGQVPDYREAYAEEVSSLFAMDIARSQFLPSLNLTGSVGRQAASFFPNTDNRWSAGLQLSFPIFNGGRDLYSTRSATSSWKAAGSRRVEVSRQTLAKLEQAYAAYTEAVAKLKVDESFKLAAAVRAEIARKRYNNGLLTFEDWDVIESDLISREKAFLQSSRDRVIAEATWDQTQGKGVIP